MGLRWLATAFALAACAASSSQAQSVSMGNGEESWIIVEGMSRNGRDFTFQEVKLAEPGWLVLHPFEDGKPVGKIYVGARYLPGGTHKDVSVSVQTAPEPEPGTNFVVMLHHDVDRDRTFDFVFVDEQKVEDEAVFEGTTMIGHVISTP
jgi:hypothetical protein